MGSLAPPPVLTYVPITLACAFGIVHGIHCKTLDSDLIFINVGPNRDIGVTLLDEHLLLEEILCGKHELNAYCQLDNPHITVIT